MLKKNPLKNIFNEKIKMLKKGPFVVEFFISVGSFDYDWIRKDLVYSCET
jgi:hypothetical protein